MFFINFVSEENLYEIDIYFHIAKNTISIGIKKKNYIQYGYQFVTLYSMN